MERELINFLKWYRNEQDSDVVSEEYIVGMYLSLKYKKDFDNRSCENCKHIINDKAKECYRCLDYEYWESK